MIGGSLRCAAVLGLALWPLGCGFVGGAEASYDEAVYLTEAPPPREEAEAAEGAPLDFDGRGGEDDDDSWPALAAGDDDSPVVPPPPPPPPPPPAPEPEPEASDDDSAKPERVDLDERRVEFLILERKEAKQNVQIQQQVINEQMEDADDLNDDLAAILEQLRRERGLPEEDPYTSPIQQAVDPIMDRPPTTDTDTEQLAQEVERAVEATQATAAPPDDEVRPALHDDRD